MLVCHVRILSATPTIRTTTAQFGFPSLWFRRCLLTVKFRQKVSSTAKRPQSIIGSAAEDDTLSLFCIKHYSQCLYEKRRKPAPQKGQWILSSFQWHSRTWRYLSSLRLKLLGQLGSNIISLHHELKKIWVSGTFPVNAPYVVLAKLPNKTKFAANISIGNLKSKSTWKVRCHRYTIRDILYDCCLEIKAARLT